VWIAEILSLLFQIVAVSELYSGIRSSLPCHLLQERQWYSELSSMQAIMFNVCMNMNLKQLPIVVSQTEIGY